MNAAPSAPDLRPLLYSRTCQHALRAMERLASRQREWQGALLPLSRLAADTGTPAAALAQIVHLLGRAGLVESRRGPSGGVRLSRAARKISVLEIVRAAGDASLEGRCILGLPACADATPCPAHPVWKKARAMLEKRLESRSLAHLARAAARKTAALRRSR